MLATLERPAANVTTARRYVITETKFGASLVIPHKRYAAADRSELREIGEIFQAVLDAGWSHTGQCWVGKNNELVYARRRRQGV